MSHNTSTFTRIRMLDSDTALRRNGGKRFSSVHPNIVRLRVLSSRFLEGLNILHNKQHLISVSSRATYAQEAIRGNACPLEKINSATRRMARTLNHNQDELDLGFPLSMTFLCFVLFLLFLAFPSILDSEEQPIGVDAGRPCKY